MDFSNPHLLMVLIILFLFLMTIFAYLYSFMNVTGPKKKPVDPKAKFFIPNDGGALQKYKD